MLNPDNFVTGDAVIVKLRNHPQGHEHYGIIISIDNTQLSILGKPLAWVLAGDLQLDKYNFNASSIEEVKLYTRYGATDAWERAKDLLREERMNIIIGNPPFQT